MESGETELEFAAVAEIQIRGRGPVKLSLGGTPWPGAHRRVQALMILVHISTARLHIRGSQNDTELCDHLHTTMLRTLLHILFFSFFLFMTLLNLHFCPKLFDSHLNLTFPQRIQVTIHITNLHSIFWQNSQSESICGPTFNISYIMLKLFTCTEKWVMLIRTSSTIY